MLQIRKSVFETNSSSTHSLTMCKASEYEAWEKGEMVYYSEEFLTIEEVKTKCQEHKNKYVEKYGYFEGVNCSNWDELKEYLKENASEYDCYLSPDDFWDSKEYYEGFHDSYDGVVAFGYFGAD